MYAGRLNATSSPYQRLTIRCRLRDRDLPTDRVTVLHRDLFKRAQVPFNEGNDLDAELCAMTKAQASALIRELPDQED